MRNGFKFKNIHSSDLGVTVKTKSRPIRPEVKSFTADIPCRDGTYDFSRSNPMGREFFYDRIISVSVFVQTDSLEAMQNKLSELAVWLTGEGELIFDDMPHTVWNGRILDEIIYLPEHAGRCAVIELSFKVKPFSTCVFSSDGPVIDFEVPLDYNIPIGIDAYLKGTVTGNGSINVLNFGDRPVRPVIKLTGSAEDVIINACGKKLSFSASGDVIIDCANQNVKDDSGYIAVSGEFFELRAGVNEINITNSNTSEVSMELSYSPEFTYGVNPETIDWSVDNA